MWYARVLLRDDTQALTCERAELTARARVHTARRCPHCLSRSHVSGCVYATTIARCTLHTEISLRGTQIAPYVTPPGRVSACALGRYFERFSAFQRSPRRNKTLAAQIFLASRDRDTNLSKRGILAMQAFDILLKKIYIL